MAIDTSMYGNMKAPPSFAETMNPFIQMMQTRENIKTSQAQRPGIEADVKEKQRIAARNQAVQDITAKFAIPAATGPDGKPVVGPDGKPAAAGFDAKGAATALASAGYWQDASVIQKDTLDQKAQELQNAYAEGANPLLIAKMRKSLDDDILGDAARTADQIPNAKNRTEYLTNAVNYAVSRGVSEKDPRIGALMSGNTKAVANSAATPMDREQLSLQQGQLGVAQGQLGVSQRQQTFDFSQGGFTPEGKDPNSAISKRAREIAAGAGLKVDPNMSLWEMRQQHGFADVLKEAQSAQIMPAGARAGAVEKVGALSGVEGQYDNAIDAVGSVRKSGGVTSMGTVIGSFSGTLWQKLKAQNPQLAALETAVEIHNQNNPNDIIDLKKSSLDQIESKLRTGKANVQSAAKGALQVARTTRFPGEPQPAPAAQAAPSAPPKRGALVRRSGFTYRFDGGDPYDKNNWTKVQ